MLSTVFRTLVGGYVAPGDLLTVIIPALLVGVVWFRQMREPRPRRPDGAINVVCLAASLAALSWFLRFGAIPWDRLDFGKDGTYYWSLQEAVRRGRMPFYLSLQMQGTDRYWGNLEAPLGPHSFLLGVMSVNVFFMLHALVTFAIGYAALVAWRREVGLSSFAFVTFVALFLFNGHITAHLSVGHTMWVGYFLLPWVFLSLTRAARGDSSMRNAATLALALGGMIAIGAWHIFVWSLLFAVFFCATSWSGLRFVARVSIMLAAVSAFRVLPGLVTFKGGDNLFLQGFSSPRLMFDALALGHTERFATERLNYWEYDTYIGSVGFVLLCAGLWPTREPELRFLNRFYVPIGALTLLSVGRVYAVTLFRLPGFSAERITTRMLIVPVIALLWLGCLRVDRVLTRHMHRRRAVAVLALVGACLLVTQLMRSTLWWRLPAVAAPAVAQSALFERTPVDRAYLWSIWGGCAVSLSAIGAMGRMFLSGPRARLG
jgi:hypothetical protein